MSRRTHTAATSKCIRTRMAATGADGHKVAEAADMTITDLNSRLNGVDEFTVAELVLVGGFLRLTPTQLLTEAA
jgi:methylglyoxal synthase